MSVFCLVHGSTQGPSGWNRLAAALDQGGHECICVDLPHDRPDWGADAYAAEIGRQIPRDGGAIVVAHSASGLILPFVPRHAPVKKLIYLAAVIPMPGVSFMAQYRADPSLYQPDFAGKDPTKDEATAMQYLFHDCSTEAALWACSTLRLMFARQALLEECPLKSLREEPSIYVSCTMDRTINPEWWEAAARERLGCKPIRFEAGHAPHASRPEELAGLLESICL
jgi:pimeloyl-ACP methyl ester carboxylesterase